MTRARQNSAPECARPTITRARIPQWRLAMPMQPPCAAPLLGAALGALAATGPAGGRAKRLSSKPITLMCPSPAGRLHRSPHAHRGARTARQVPGSARLRREPSRRRRHAGPANMAQERQARTAYKGGALHPGHAAHALHAQDQLGSDPGLQLHHRPQQAINDYIEAARKSPGTIDYGSTGAGSSAAIFLIGGSARTPASSLKPCALQGAYADMQQALLGGQ
ncbi:hypothetical protein FQR65_LT20770 [Abscondita terminalis]|nr:hypothetical protein FQR65_LT20770 [Abscondita terminalis]